MRKFKKRTIKNKFAKRSRNNRQSKHIRGSKQSKNIRRSRRTRRSRRYKQRGGALTIYQAVDVIKNYNPDILTAQGYLNYQQAMTQDELLEQYYKLYENALITLTRDREGSIPLLEDPHHIDFTTTDDLVDRITSIDPQTGLPLYTIEQQGEITEEIIDLAQQLLNVEEKLGKNIQGVAPSLQMERRMALRQAPDDDQYMGEIVGKSLGTDMDIE